MSEKSYPVIAICSPYGVGKTTVTEQLFSFFLPETFLCSKSVALRQFPSEENVKEFLRDITKKKQHNEVLILNPHIVDYLELLKKNPCNIFGIFLNANKSTVESHLEKKGNPPEEIKEAVQDAIQQINLYYNYRNNFLLTIDVDEGISARMIAKQIARELIKKGIAQDRKNF